MRKWQLQEAKAKLSDLIYHAVNKGPQNITVRGQPMAVVLSMHEYEKLTRNKPTFLELMLHSPLIGMKLDVQRNKSMVREVEL